MSDYTEFFNYPDLEISILEEKDMAKSIELINHAFAHQNEAKGRERINKEELTKKMSDTDFYVINQGNQLVACVSIELKKESLYLGLLSVADNFRNGKLAPIILSSIEEYARSLGYRKMSLSFSSASEWLKSYYEKNGFRESGERRSIGWCDLVDMTKQL